MTCVVCRDRAPFFAEGASAGAPQAVDGDPEDLAERLAWPVEGVLFDVERNGFWHPAWPSRPAEMSEALRAARTELGSVPRLVPVYGHRYLPGTAGEHGHPVLSVYQTDIILYGNDLTDYIHHEFTGRAASLLARTTVDFWSYFVEGGQGIDVTAPTPFAPYATSTQEAVDCLRMLALERLIGRRHHPEQFVEAALTALVLGVEAEPLSLLAGLTRTEHDQADALFDQVLTDLDLLRDPSLEAARWELVRWWLRLIVNGSVAPGAGGDLITYEGWARLARPLTLGPLVGRTETYNDWAAIRRGDEQPLADSIVEEAQRLLDGPWPPQG